MRDELGMLKNAMYDMHMTLCVKEVAAREVAVEEVAETEVVERDVAVEEVAEKEAVIRGLVMENGLVEMVRRMDIAKVDGS